MCGIAALLMAAGEGTGLTSELITAPATEEIAQAIYSRGPDVQGSRCVDGILLLASVLHLRGLLNVPTPQPATDDKGNVLLWNGEVFGGVELRDGENDTMVMLRRLGACDTKLDVLTLLEQVQGPFAFVYYHHSSRSLFYGRDKLGRRSLVAQLFGSSSKAVVLISSVAVPRPPGEEAKGGPQEIETGGIFRIDVACGQVEMLLWKFVADTLPHVAPIHASSYCRSPFITEEVVPSPCVVPAPVPGTSPSVALLSVLSEAVRVRVEHIPRLTGEGQASVGLLFSGGIDCMVLGALADKFLPPDHALDLINVAFVGDFEGCEEFLLSTIPDRATAVNGYLELKALTRRKINLIQVDISTAALAQYRLHILQLLAPCTTIMDFNIGSVLWFGARATGSLYDGPEEYLDNEFCRYSSEDSAPVEEAEGGGPVTPPPAGSSTRQRPLYSSQSRVLLSGLGADELMAGYGRHRTTFRKEGLQQLQRELDKDLRRLWRRNLGRDDRLISDHGREVRHPYLDERVIDFVHHTAIGDLCDLTLPSGIGDKRILREAARLLGLQKSSRLVKRAMQFGSRIANNKVAGYAEMSSAVELLDVVNPHMLRPEASRSYCSNDRCGNFAPCPDHDHGSGGGKHKHSSARRTTDQKLSKATNRRLGKPGYEF